LKTLIGDDLERMDARKREIPTHKAQVNISTMALPLAGFFFTGSEGSRYGSSI